ncbi:hypothetical protein D3C79_545410 [compost metagenome]
MVELADFDGRTAQAAALGHVGVDVVEMAEGFSVARGFTVDGEGVGGRGVGREAHAQQCNRAKQLWEQDCPRTGAIRQRGCT